MEVRKHIVERSFKLITKGLNDISSKIFIMVKCYYFQSIKHILFYRLQSKSTCIHNNRLIIKAR